MAKRSRNEVEKEKAVIFCIFKQQAQSKDNTLFDCSAVGKLERCQ